MKLNLNMYKMMSLTIKKCAPCLQIRQFANLICDKNRVDKKSFNSLINYTYLNYSSLINPKHKTYYRPFYDNVRMMSKESRLPPLMNVPFILRRPLLSPYYSFVFLKQVREEIDRTFSLLEFRTGAAQAVVVVSSALASRNYEALTDLIEHHTLEKLIGRVNALTESQRELLIIKDQVSLACCNMNVTKSGTDNVNIQITVLGYYMHITLDFSSSLPDMHVLLYNYTFQRTYKDGEGGPWIITMANHCSQE
nr:uncharacterized protein LOC116427492 [Nomia melanderi]